MEKKIKVGIIGCGYWGPNLIRNFNNNPNCEIKCISDLRPGRLEFINSLYPGIKTSADPADVYDDKDIDAVVIATPVSTHKDLGVRSMLNGKDVFIEKPLTNDLKSAEELLMTAAKQKKIIAVGHIFQFSPAVAAIKDFINEGKLGRVHHLTSQRINLGPPKTTVDVVWDLGPHDLSIIFYLFDEFPDKINAFGQSCWWEGYVDNAHIYLDFPSGKSAHIHLSWLSSKKIRDTKIFGETGNIEYNETAENNKVVFYDKGIDNRINAKDNEAKNLQYGVGSVYNVPVKAGEPLSNEVNAFIDSVISRTEPINNGTIGMQVVKSLELITKSIKENNNG
jgi:predicted dehydrogenase